MSPENPGIAAIYPELRIALLAFLRRHTGDTQTAEDLLHDVILKALLAERAQAPAPKHPSAWLYAVARNAAIDHHRRKRPTEALPEDLAEVPNDESEALRIELSHCLRPLAERLPALYRETLLAAEFEGQPLREVAQAQGLSLAAVKTRASRGRRLLQEQLIACCRVELSHSGQILDYDTQAVAQCAPSCAAGTATPTDCRSSRRQNQPKPLS
ncbi:RNA polymerase sigma (SigZ) subunit [Pseudomonas sp. SJZ079]|uniref:sigma-70 family RNA polymerase sigma factor n=1 Tax=Pseudomonas sp. SJZ079 TaxID=2572887 RepID=UPI00119BEE4C|nr:sigma-70 family RNA polymerase sigma factor [Pseudomonas sp. SJZ079]TWC35618.1 RNA polymerase sigma (SigZ) subunit [Pseudomonas sp. SJZ079]